MKIVALVMLLLFGYLFLVIMYDALSTVEISDLQCRKGIFYRINEQKPFTGTALSHYSPIMIEYSQQFKNGVLHGYRYVYYENGQVKEKAFYKNGNIVGNPCFYYENGELK